MKEYFKIKPNRLNKPDPLINISIFRTILLFFILVFFISENPVSQEFELNENTEIICETEESAGSESKESFRKDYKNILKALIIPVKNKFKNYLDSVTFFSSGTPSHKFSFVQYFFVFSIINNYPHILQNNNANKSNNSFFVNISRLKELRISNMRC